jgi:predicted MPP superfamily phosphohydrolase
MEARLWIRDVVVLVPLIAAQVGIYLALQPTRRVWAWLYALLAAAAVAVNLLSIAELLGMRVDHPWAHWISAADGVGQTALFTSAAAYAFYRIARWAGGMVPPRVAEERRALLQTAGTLAIATPVLAMAYGITIGRTEFGIREVTIPIPNLHPDLEGLRILHLSDIHRGEFLSANELERVIDMTKDLRPHLSIMTGDLISKPGDPMEECVRQLARVKSDAGMVGCLGNHELYARAEAAVKAEAARRGIPFLRQENTQLRFGAATINIGGVDYQRSTQKQDYLKNAEKLLVPGTLNLLLSHNPDVFPKAAEQGWDLTLAGHTHGGQMTVEILEQTVNVARFFTPYVAGAYRLGKASCYVTRGIGTVGIPARLGVPPEISLLRLRKA